MLSVSLSTRGSDALLSGGVVRHRRPYRPDTGMVGLGSRLAVERAAQSRDAKGLT
jgi:hypothetical protein